ncbi:hypothetical protein [Phenylobacterium sp.]|uniref:hypothetical protein n=1 Tax=Phenylobacterium sp. TaxID=1871053 RepID=UPI002F93BF8B
MSLAEPTTAKPDGKGSFFSKLPSQATDTFDRVARGSREAFERIARQPHPRLTLGKDRDVVIHTDRVRAKPAISPTLSMNIGANAVLLGIWGTLFPGHVKKTLGIKAPEPVVQAVFGARELWTGFTLAGDPTKSEVLWARVAGDVFDIVALKALDNRHNPKRGTARAALGFVLFVTALDVIAASRMTNVKRNCL